jgi:hypothetical protein
MLAEFHIHNYPLYPYSQVLYLEEELTACIRQYLYKESIIILRVEQ